MKFNEDNNRFFSKSKLLNEDGQPDLLWHGSKTNTLKEFDSRYEGTGVVSVRGEKYGGFFFSNDKKGAEYYCNGGVPEEKIDTERGEIFIETYGGDEEGWYYIVSQRDDIAYSVEYEKAVKEYIKKHGEDANLYNMEIDIEDVFEQIGNGGEYQTQEEAEEAGNFFLEEHNKCVENNINPYLYPVHLRMEKPYIHDTKKDGFVSGKALIKKVMELNEGYDGIKITDTFDGDREMDVYIIFDPKNIMILDKMNPEKSRITIPKQKKVKTKKRGSSPRH